MQNVFVENIDNTDNIQIESSSVEYTIVVESVEESQVVAELPTNGPANVVIDYTPGQEYEIIIEHSIKNVSELGLPAPVTDGQILASLLDGTLYWTDPYEHPSQAALGINANTGQVLDTLVTNDTGHVTSVTLRYLVAADIPNLPISKITGLQTELNNRYTETELQTSGLASVHWDNITNVPATITGSHLDLTDIGVYTHVQIDSHINDATIHFTEASIDHTAITNIGINSHAQIDTHIANNSIHFSDLSGFDTDDLNEGSTNLYSQWITSGSNIYYSLGDVFINNSSSGLHFDTVGADGGGQKRITCNDGGGNFNIRSGSYYSSGEKYTTAGGGAIHIVFDTDSGNADLSFKIAEAGTNAGDAITYAKTLELSTTNMTWDGGFNLGSTTTVSSILDEDDMASNSATALATQQSIKAYIDANSSGTFVGLSDTPSTLTGNALKYLRVNIGESSLEYVAAQNPGLWTELPSAAGISYSTDISTEYVYIKDTSGDEIRFKGSTDSEIALRQSSSTKVSIRAGIRSYFTNGVAIGTASLTSGNLLSVVGNADISGVLTASSLSISDTALSFSTTGHWSGFTSITLNGRTNGNVHSVSGVITTTSTSSSTEYIGSITGYRSPGYTLYQGCGTEPGTVDENGRIEITTGGLIYLEPPTATATYFFTITWVA